MDSICSIKKWFCSSFKPLLINIIWDLLFIKNEINITKEEITKEGADNNPVKLNIDLKELVKSIKDSFSVRSLMISIGVFFIFFLFSNLYMGYKRGHSRNSY